MFKIFLEKWGYLHGYVLYCMLGGPEVCSPEKIKKMVQFGAFWRIFC